MLELHTVHLSHRNSFWVTLHKTAWTDPIRCKFSHGAGSRSQQGTSSISQEILTRSKWSQMRRLMGELVRFNFLFAFIIVAGPLSRWSVEFLGPLIILQATHTHTQTLTHWTYNFSHEVLQPIYLLIDFSSCLCSPRSNFLILGFIFV